MVCCVPHERGQDSGEVFGDVIGHRVDVTDDESELCLFLVDLGETIDAWNGLSRVQTVIGRVVNVVVFFTFLKVVYHLLLVAAGGVSF